jgi:hypothetical protein
MVGISLPGGKALWDDGNIRAGRLSARGFIYDLSWETKMETNGCSKGGKRRAILAAPFPWQFTTAIIGKMAVETAFVSRFRGLDTGNGKRAQAKGNENGNEGEITTVGVEVWGEGFYSDSASLLSS